MFIYKLSLIISLILFNLHELNFQALNCIYGNANIGNDPRIASLYNNVIFRSIPNYRITNFYSFCTRNVGNLVNIYFDADVLNNNLNYNIKDDIYVNGQTIVNATTQLTLRSQINQVASYSLNTMCLNGNSTIKSNVQSVSFFNNFARYFPINSAYLVSNYRSFCYNNVVGTTRAVSLDTDVCYLNAAYRLTATGCFAGSPADAPITTKITLNKI